MHISFLHGDDVSRMSVNQLAEIRNKQLGFVFQQFNLLSRTSALENVELPMIYAGISGRERRERSMAMLKMVDLENSCREEYFRLAEEIVKR